MNKIINNYLCLFSSFVGGFGLMLALYSYYNREISTAIFTLFASTVVTYTSVKELQILIKK